MRVFYIFFSFIGSLALFAPTTALSQTNPCTTTILENKTFTGTLQPLVTSGTKPPAIQDKLVCKNSRATSNYLFKQFSLENIKYSLTANKGACMVEGHGLAVNGKMMNFLGTLQHGTGLSLEILVHSDGKKLKYQFKGYL